MTVFWKAFAWTAIPIVVLHYYDLTPISFGQYRSFVYDGETLPDPDPRLTIDEVRRVFEEFFPELGHASLTVKESQEGGKTVYVFERTLGSKGCDDDNGLPKLDGGHRHQRDRPRALAVVG